MAWIETSNKEAWIHKSADAGYAKAKETLANGLINKADRLREKSEFNECAKLYEQAWRYDSSKAAYELGMLYHFDLHDSEKAGYWLKLAARAGNTDAISALRFYSKS